MRRRCRLAERYRKWAGLEPEEPTWGWVWAIVMDAVIALGVAVWAVLALWVFARCVG